MKGLKTKLVAFTDFQFCEYIENTSLACIDTGIAGGTKFAYAIDFQFTVSKVNNWAQMLFKNGVNTGIWAVATSQILNICSYAVPLSSRYLVSTNSGYVVINGTKKFAYNLSDNWGTGNLFLFNAFANDKGHNSLARLYGCKFWKDGDLVRDFTPVFQCSTELYGLYDKVEDKFYGSATSSKFDGKLISGGAIVRFFCVVILNLDCAGRKEAA